MTLAYFKLKEQEAPKYFEPILDCISFNVHKFNHRIKPKKSDRIKIISCFSEFGCEVLGSMYCIPRLMRRYPGAYVIVMGWHGREYLYRHLVDEFWEVKEEYMWMRDAARAFHHISRNLTRLELGATLYGEVVPAAALGKYAVCNFCRTCGKFWHEWRKRSEFCPACKSTLIITSIFTDIARYKPQARPIPRPSEELLQWAKTIVPSKAVGVFARGRKTYGRNLQPDFYIKLIDLLRGMGYEVIWLGETQSTQLCPKGVMDFSGIRDLEKVLAIVCNLQFTIQFWTASSRLSGIMGVPYIIFESPEQIYCSHSGIVPAQEGKRLELSTFGKKKVVLAHFKNVFNDHEQALGLVERAISEMNLNNWDDIIGMVEDKEFSTQLQEEYWGMLT